MKALTGDMYKSHVVSMCTIHFSDVCVVASSKVPAPYDRHSHFLPKFSRLWIRRVRIQHDETIPLASRLIVARCTWISSRASISSWRCMLSCITSHLTLLSWIFFSSSPSLSFIVPSLYIYSFLILNNTLMFFFHRLHLSICLELLISSLTLVGLTC